MLYCYFHWMGNGVCEPECNNEHNFYDMGDCCLPTSVVGPDTFCNDHIDGNFSMGVSVMSNCSCHVTNQSIELSNTIGCRYPYLVHDFFCHDQSNTPECNYDGGDCCRRAGNKRCRFCTCHVTGKQHTWGPMDSYLSFITFWHGSGSSPEAFFLMSRGHTIWQEIAAK